MTWQEFPPALVAAMVVPGFFMVAGIVGNVFTVVRLRQSEEVTSGMRNYLVPLALWDLGATCVSVGRFWVVAMSRQDPFSRMSFLCQLVPCADFILCMVPAWILVAMALQVHQGLKMPVNSGNNVTKWKARLFAGTVLFFSLLFNAHILMFFKPPNENGTSSSGEAGSSANLTEASTGPDDTRVCVPQAGAYARFYDDAWPYISLSASVCMPLLALCVLCGTILRLLIVRSRPSTHVPLLASFRTLITTVLFLGLSTVLTSGPLCGLSFLDAEKLWTDYPETLPDKESWQGGQYTLWVILRLLFYLQFSGRWVVTCCCYRLWRKNSISGRSDT